MIASKALLLLTAVFSPVLGYYPVKGPADGTVQPRLEINKVIADADQWNILLLAMQKFQNTADKDASSYYSIAAIHGVAQAWDDEPRVQTRTNSGAGYCFHTSQEFFLWHRPYMSVFEQALVKHAVDIANTYKDPAVKARALKAASTLRLPYWDWASNAAVPQAIQATTATVNDPVKGSQQIPNPMFSYTFKDPRGNPTRAPKTTRDDGYNGRMTDAQADFKTAVATMFNTPNTCWNVFTSNARGENQVCAPGTTKQLVKSLEGVHNDVHVNICGSMCSFTPAAFDPIFWLHHSNVDRIGALWQAINYQTFVPATPNSVRTFAVDAKTLDANSPLIPFRSADTSRAWWTNTGVRDTKALGYTYPELQGGLTGAALAKSVQDKVNAMYGVGRTLQSLGGEARRVRHRSLRDAAKRAEQPNNLVVPPTLDELAPFRDMLIANNGAFPDWVARINVTRTNVPLAFTVKLYLGETEEQNRVGGISMLSGEDMPERSIEADIPFTDGLLHKLVAKEIDNLDADTVNPYATKNLKWKAVGGDGKDYSEGVQVDLTISKNNLVPKNGADLPPALTTGSAVVSVPAATGTVAADPTATSPAEPTATETSS